MADFTTAELITCIRREIVMREKMYPLWVSQKRMKQEKADYEIAAMHEVLHVLEELKVLEDGHRIDEKPQRNLQSH
jgi:hypothetical protein